LPTTTALIRGAVSTDFILSSRSSVVSVAILRWL
jgi:hypothetical protein